MNRKSIYLALTVFVCCLVLGIVIFITVTKRHNDTIVEKDYQIEAFNDTLKVWKDKDSLNNASISNLVMQNTKQFLTLQLGEKELIRLQDIIKKYEKDLKKGGSALYVDSEVKFDTLYIPKYIPVDYVFTDTVSNKWIDFTYTKDTQGAKFSLKTRSSLDIVIGRESKGFLWKTYTPMLKIVDNNPYSTPTSARSVSFDKSFRQKRFGIGPSAGYMFDNNFKGSFKVGITANYNLIYLF